MGGTGGKTALAAGTALGVLSAQAAGLGTNSDANNAQVNTITYSFVGATANTQYTGPLLTFASNTTNPGYWIQLDFQANGTNMAIRSRNGASLTWTSWAKFYNSANTTTASDGTIKAASPIIELFGDGSFQLNDESEGCTVSRLSVGEYLIEGCTGLNADAAWGGIDGGFDIPTDRNKQPLVWLDYEVNADGSILVRTYHRTYPAAPAFARNDITGLTDGEPIDIPKDQFVSVRVEMPESSIWNQQLKAISEECKMISD